MPDPTTALVVGGSQLLGGILGADAASDAANTQAGTAQLGINKQDAQFQAIQKLLQPYVTAGGGALTAQQNILGLNGAGAQGQSIAGIEQSPIMQALSRQGENSILQNASATGGLRGGNVQSSLAKFRPQLLNSLIDQQYGRLGGLTTLGQNSAVGVGNAGQVNANNVAQLLGQQGAAQAGGILGQANAYGNILGLPSQVLGAQVGAKGQLGGVGFGSLFG